MRLVFPKKGKKSVGVARQWMGRQGKTDNCQVAVFRSPGCGAVPVSLIDTELYLPQEWVKDPDRCATAGVPLDRRALKTKPALALELVQRARRNGVRFCLGRSRRRLWPGSGTAEEPGRCGRGLRNRRSSQPKDFPRRSLSSAAPGRAGFFSPPRLCGAVGGPAVPGSVGGGLEFATAAGGSCASRRCRSAVLQLLEGSDTQARSWQLVVTREKRRIHKEIKYSLSNAPLSTSLSRTRPTCRGSAYWVEKSLSGGQKRGRYR